MIKNTATKHYLALALFMLASFTVAGLLYLFVIDRDDSQDGSAKSGDATVKNAEDPIEDTDDSQMQTNEIDETDQVADNNLETEELDPAPNPAPTTSNNVLGCTDCSLAPVDKQNALSSTYYPSVVATGLNGGGFLTASTQQNLSSMFSNASSLGLELNIISAYRSYDTQVSTFAYWVQQEIAKGTPRAQAEVDANVHSARPGHSEHQLGTTADISCLGCTAFDFSQNQAAYEYLEANAHTFGFAISYPRNTQSLTGYTYEPWHIRYIGVDLATELYNTGYISGNGNYLAQFLTNKGLF